MIDYNTYCRIRQFHCDEGLKAQQIADELSLDARTVERWMNEETYCQRKPLSRPSKLDPFKPLLSRWLEQHQFTGE